MEEILKDFQFPIHPDLLVGTDTRDDAGVYRLNQDTAIIQTLDFFTPMVDDPFLFGQIAAVNALNDVYAMGGVPLLAMNIVAFPQCEDLQILKQILAGGLSKIEEAGALLVGGHTVDDLEPKYGLAVTGLVHPDKITANKGARPGDLLLLSKPLGNGIIATAIKAEMVSSEAYTEATGWMATLNRTAAQIMGEVGVHAATDVTGFGLLGHLYEMASASEVSVQVFSQEIKFMADVLEYASMGLIPGGAYSNRDYLGDKIQFDQDLDPVIRDLLCSPETAGGLLVAVDKTRADQLTNAWKESGIPAILVGQVTEPGKPIIKVRT